ncbi:hypothetical protein [uncultured Mediterranea sp.]|uniref:hypothetical protein n=1 Tax=uncultured Mediterranea sp. TaxID=1926662 RepID=UPI0027D93666|nr:hypothetical protein [uncultured Mediterranea sp.]
MIQGFVKEDVSRKTWRILSLFLPRPAEVGKDAQASFPYHIFPALPNACRTATHSPIPS